MTTKNQALMRIEALWDEAQQHLVSLSASPMRRIDQLMDAALAAEANNHRHTPRVEGDLDGIAAMVTAASAEPPPSSRSKTAKTNKALSFARAKEKMDKVAKLKAPAPASETEQIRQMTKGYLQGEGEALIASTIKDELKAYFQSSKK